MVSIRGIKTILAEITEADAEAILRLRNDPHNNKFLFQKPITPEEQISWIKKNSTDIRSKNFKVTDLNNEFKGTISIYNIENGRGEFGRYIVTNPVNAVEAEYLLLKYCFEDLGLDAVYCQTNLENRSVWSQHLKLGFKEVGQKDVAVGSSATTMVKAIVQEITSEEFRNFDYEKIMRLIKHF